MAVTPRAPDDPHTHLDDATQVFPGATPISSDATQVFPGATPISSDATRVFPPARPAPDALDSTLVMPRRERPAWRADEPAEEARQLRQARRLRHRKLASMAFAATGLIVVTSGAWALLGSEPGDPTFAGAIPTVPVAEAPVSSGPAAVAPLTPLDADASEPGYETWTETVTPTAGRTSSTPRVKRSAQAAAPSPAGVAAETPAATPGRRARKATPDAGRTAAAASVSIASPRNGESVEENVTVSGEAEVPDGHQVYLLTGTDQATTSCAGEGHFVCGPVTLDDGEETVPLAVVVAPEGDAGDAVARDEITVQRPAE
ncbi:hypothetical protein [Actinoplanes sp. NPDC023714]|uniref:hypothetical protein n=1 Tax=Actinoplanes sp. NPDC023714 TaxID=3154322 RepID=UPI00340331F4